MGRRPAQAGPATRTSRRFATSSPKPRRTRRRRPPPRRCRPTPCRSSPTYHSANGVALCGPRQYQLPVAVAAYRGVLGRDQEVAVLVNNYTLQAVCVRDLEWSAAQVQKSNVCRRQTPRRSALVSEPLRQRVGKLSCLLTGSARNAWLQLGQAPSETSDVPLQSSRESLRNSLCALNNSRVVYVIQSKEDFFQVSHPSGSRLCKNMPLTSSRDRAGSPSISLV